MKQPPVILIAPGTQKQGLEFQDFAINLSQKYALAILAAGGLPFILPCIPQDRFLTEAVAHCDGVMLTGGDDVQPELYTTELSPALRKTVSEPEPTRDLTETQLIRETFAQRKPLLALCRGQQILNVALGGDLIVDIASQVPEALRHQRLDRKNDVVHDIALAEGSILAGISPRPGVLGVNSSHHQAVNRVASGLRPAAVSRDGVVEALEWNPADAANLPFLLAVQFHPERLFEQHAEHLELFKTFTQACTQTRR